MKRIGAALVLLLVLAGCGVRPSGVVYAGSAPDGIARGPMLYFLKSTIQRSYEQLPPGSPETTRLPRPEELVPTIRDTGELGTATDALRLLVAGPTPDETVDGLHTDVPGFAPEQVSAGDPVDGVVTVQLPVPPSTLSAPATTQLICTAVGVNAMSGANAKNLMVRLTGMGDVWQPQLCPATQ